MKPTSILEVMPEIAPLWDEARLKIDEVRVRGLLHRNIFMKTK